MNNIPTAEEFIPNYLDANSEFMESMREQMSKLKGFNFDNIPDLMIEFAKLHVEAALKAASESALIRETNYKGSWTSESISIDDYTNAVVDKESILNSYQVTNIK